MSDVFRIQYPIEAYDGGLNNKYEPNIIADDESPDALNVVYDDRGGIQTRNGSRKLNTLSVGSFTGDGLFTCRFNDGTEQMVGWWNGSMFKWTGSSFTTIASAQSVFTAGTRVDMFEYQNLCFFGNGGSKPYKYNGTDFTRHGIPQPNSTPTAASGTTGANRPPTGDINYKVSYENSYVVESDVSTFTTTLNLAASASVALTSLPVAPQSFGVATRILYRRDSSTGGIFKRVTRISDNTTTTFTDTVSAGSLTVSAPVDQGEPPNWKFGISHQERGWVVDQANQPGLLYYSELETPFTYKATNFIPIGDGDGERIKGIAVHSDNIAVGKDASVWLIYMPSSDPVEWLRVKSHSKFGQASHYASAGYGAGLLMFLAEKYGIMAGFAALNGADTQPNAVDLSTNNVFTDLQSDRIEPELFLLDTAQVERSCAIEFKNKLWFSVPRAGGSGNNRIYQFDFQRRDKDQSSGSWTPFTGLNVAAFTISSGKLYGQSSTANGTVYELDVLGLYSDDGAAINSYAWTKEFQGHQEHWENQKNFRYVNFLMETLGAWFMNVYYRVDSDKGIGTQVQVNLNPGGSLWGTMTWGVDLWGGGVNRKKVTVNLATASGKFIQFRFDNANTAGRAFHVLPKSSFFYNLRGYR